MKNMFKLAAIAVSMALVMSLAACSSGDDDVVDASTPKYLVAAQIDQYVASIKYEQNVSDDEIKSLKETHEDFMKFIDGCADCLDAYFSSLKSKAPLLDEDGKVILYVSAEIEELKAGIKWIKNCYGTKEIYHEAFVYKHAVGKALYNVWSKTRKNVDDIGDPNGDTILKGALNERQAASMKAYTDAVAALKAALSDDDSKKCETKIKAANDAIDAFGKLENKNVNRNEIVKVLDAVDEMCEDINTKVYDKLTKK